MTAALALAAQLTRARDAAVIAEGASPPQTLEDAHCTATLVYQELERRGGRQLGWKLGATDAVAQERLGANAPFVAPVYDAMSAPLPTLVSLGRLVAPILEVEIGIELGSTVPILRPCAEIADSRFPGWVSSLPEAIADFGLQGLMLIGRRREAVPVVAATVWHDGEERGCGSRTYAEALALASIAAAQAGGPPVPETDGRAARETDPPPVADSRSSPARAGLRGVSFVATGTITPPVPLTIGSWRIDLGVLGTVAFEVVP
jgi:2-oxo-3-hexenedioate decarboxylase